MRPFKPGESLKNIVQTAIPDFVEADYPLFVEFVSAFVRFLENARSTESAQVYPAYGRANTTVQKTTEFGGPAYEARKLLEYRDISSTLDEFTKHFLSMFAKNFPQYAYIPAHLVVRTMRQFYQGKGTEDTIRWFFRAFFNQHAEVYFPREDILKASDGTWKAPITLKVSQPIINPETGETPPNSDVGKFYVGQRIQTTTGSAQVEGVTTTIVGQAFNQNIVVNELTLKFDTILGEFEPGQVVHNIDSEEQVYTTIFPVISDIIITSGGSNYLPGDLVTFSEGPAGGSGYGASGQVASVASTALNGVLILNGGDGYVTGIPLSFVSTTGKGAAAFVSEVIFGDILLESDDGSLLDESSSSGPVFVIQEDRNTILLGLTIEPFANSTATVTLDSTDYGVDTGVEQMEGVVLDSAIEIALAAGTEAPFMHPWVFTDAARTNATLANAAAILALTSNAGTFANGDLIYKLSSATDVTTNSSTANVTANVIVANTSVIGQNEVFLQDVTGTLDTGQIFKVDGNGISQLGTVTTNGTANVVGTNTAFTLLSPNTHIRFADGSEHVVREVVNSTFLITFAPTDVTLSANTWSILPTGNVTSLVLQAQRYYGKIRAITLTATGQNYQTPPAVSAVSMSGEAQELFYYEPANTSILVASGVDLYEEAELEAQQDSGQVTRVKMLSSGVNYTDANGVVIEFLHGGGRTGKDATGTPVLGALTQYPGEFTTTKGFLSSDKYLQDAAFFNDYTYVIRVGESFDRYASLLRKLIHPAGFAVLGQFVDVQEAPAPTLTVDEELTTVSNE